MSIAIIGTDAVLAALPATPVQLAHACLRAGFANVIPASWGDELIASAVLRRLPQYGNGPAIQCSCPFVAHRLLTVGGDLRPVLLPLVPPPVAIARYLHVLAKPARARITYIGACPGAVDDSIDIRMSPEALIALLAEREIIVEQQPLVFESVIPPDRRRFRSQPGGVPTADALWSEVGSRTLVEIDGEDFVTEIAQHLLTGKNVLIDASARLGCACSGAVHGARNARAQITAQEPPRAASPVIDEAPVIDLELPVPAVSRTPVDVVAIPSVPSAAHMPQGTTPPHGQLAIGHRISPARGSAPIQESRASRVGPVTPRPVIGAFPVARDTEGKALPRAYVVRRRSSPKGISVVLPPEDASPDVVDTPPPPKPIEQVQPVIDVDAFRSTPPDTAPPTPPVAVVPAPEPTPVPSEAKPTPMAEPIRYEPPRSVARPVNLDPPPAPQRPSTPSPRRDTAEHHRAPAPQPAPMSRGQFIMILLAVAAIAISASAVVSYIVSRPPASAASGQTR